MELSITYYINVGQTCQLYTTILRSDMSMAYKKSQRISNNQISCHHIMNLTVLHFSVTRHSHIFPYSTVSLLSHSHWAILTVTLLSHDMHYAFHDCHMPYLHCVIRYCHMLYLHCVIRYCLMLYFHYGTRYCHMLYFHCAVHDCHVPYLRCVILYGHMP